MKMNLHTKGNDLVVLPTGSGKSIVISGIADYVNTNVLILQPSKEILEQNRAKLAMYVNPDDIAAYSASVGEKDIKKYTYATIGSIYTKPELFQHFKIVLIDECHLVNPKATGSMFTSFLKKIGNPKVIGFTATPYRNMTAYHRISKDEMIAAVTLKMVCRLKEQFWKGIIYHVDHGQLVKDGYLSPLRYYFPVAVDHRQLPLNKSESDFDVEEYEKIMKSTGDRFKDGMRWAQLFKKSILVFCSTISSAQNLAEEYGGVSVSSKTPKKERDRIIQDFKDGKIQTVFNVGVLTTGFDHPSLDCIILKRPTRSLALYYQMLGRGVRIADGKTDCTVIDYTGTVKELGRVETIRMHNPAPGRSYNGYEMWDVITESGSWHNTPLYNYKVKINQK
jgi:DNA repair protein RadD